METELVTKKLENIEQELNILKNLVLSKSNKGLVSLKGILKGVHFSDNDINKAKKSLFR